MTEPNTALLTTRQRQVLEYISLLTEPRGPTIRELCNAIEVASTATVLRHLKTLERLGLVENLGGSRGVICTTRGDAALKEVPV